MSKLNSITVAVSTVVALYSAAYAEPTAQVAVSDIVATARWVDAKVSAETTKPDVLSVEVISAQDQLVLNFGKNVSDVAETSDEVNFETLPVFQDTASTADSLELVRNFFRDFSDTATTSDQFQAAVGKLLQDLAAPTDVITFAVGKVEDGIESIDPAKRIAEAMMSTFQE